MKVKVRITQEIIDRALEEKAQCESTRCIVARALQEALGLSEKDLSVGVDEFTIYSNWQVYPLSQEACRAIRYFDFGFPVAPMEFEIEIEEKEGER